MRGIVLAALCILAAGCTATAPGPAAPRAGGGGFVFVKPAAIGSGLTAEITARGSKEGVVKVRGGSGPAAEAAGLNYATRTVCTPGNAGVAVVKPGRTWKLRSNGTYVTTFVCTLG